MRRTGTVVRDERGALKLRVARPTECEHCGMCPGRELLLELPRGDWREGDEVAVELPADRLLRASALTYLTPLAGLIAGLALGGAVGGALGVSQEAASAVAGVALMAAGFAAVRLIAPRLARRGALELNMTPCGHSADEMRKIKAENADNGGN